MIADARTVDEIDVRIARRSFRDKQLGSMWKVGRQSYGPDEAETI